MDRVDPEVLHAAVRWHRADHTKGSMSGGCIEDHWRCVVWDDGAQTLEKSGRRLMVGISQGFCRIGQ
jgi:hypothetical protein